MSARIVFSRLITAARPGNSLLSSQTHQHARTLVSSARMSAIVDSHFISQITAAEKTITNSDEPAKNGPTASAQSHVGNQLTAQVIHDITMGERHITGKEGPIQNGPTSIAQSILISGSSSSSTSKSSNQNTTTTGSEQHTGRLDSATMKKITEKEKEITGEQSPVKKGPTAKAQQHVGEPITIEVLSDITEGEKKITGGQRVKGGPTSAAQSELGKSRS